MPKAVEILPPQTRHHAGLNRNHRDRREDPGRNQNPNRPKHPEAAAPAGICASLRQRVGGSSRLSSEKTIQIKSRVRFFIARAQLKFAATIKLGGSTG